MSFMDKFCNGTFILLIQELHEGHSYVGNTFYRDIMCFTCGAASILTIIVTLTMWLTDKSDRKKTICKLSEPQQMMDGRRMTIVE